MPNDYNNDEAQALAEQVRQFDEARKQTARAPSMDKALAGIDWSQVLPPGEDASYIDRMVAKGENAFISDSQPVPAIPRPRTLNIRGSNGGSSRAPADAKPGDVVEVDFGGGRIAEVEVEQAVRQGFIKRDRDGGYKPIGADEIEAEKAEKQRQQQDELKERDAQLVALRASGDEPSAAVQSAVELVNSRVPGPATIAAIEDYIQNGTLAITSVHKIADHVGWQHQQAEQITEGLVTGWREQAARAVVSAGVPREEVEAVYAYAAEYHPLDHKNAARNLVLASDAGPLRELAAKYKAWKHIRTQR